MTRILPGDIVFAALPDGRELLSLVTQMAAPLMGVHWYFVRPLRWPLSAEPVIRSGEQLRLVASMRARAEA